jgi:hypothetical protein
MNLFTKFKFFLVLCCFSLGTVNGQIFINEVDADTPGTDTGEFVELYDGGAGNTALDGYVVVFYNGSNDKSYNAFDLDGFTTNADGLFVLGNIGVNGVTITFNSNGLQNGADAVALYQADATDFPNGTAPTAINLIDAVVYDTNDGDDAGLLSDLGQTIQYNEDANNDKDIHSFQRDPDGSTTIVTTIATPGILNAGGVVMPPVVTTSCFNDFGTFTNEVVANDNTVTNTGAWNAANQNYEFNGFCGGGCGGNVDFWTISPVLNYTGATGLDFNFTTDESFSATDLLVRWSSDYTGSGDPTAATWTTLATFSNVDGAQSVDLIAIPAADLANFYVAFQYMDNGGYSRWRVSDIEIASDACDCTVDVVAVSNVSACDDGGTVGDSSDDTFTFDVMINYTTPPTTGDLVITAYSGSEVIATETLAVGAIGPNGQILMVTAPTIPGDLSVTAQFLDNPDCFDFNVPGVSVPSSCSTETCSELFFSEYIEGSGNNKCVEIYNPTQECIVLDGYEVKIYSNGATTPNNTIVLSGTILSGDVFVVCDDDSADEFLAEADIEASGTFWNGNDAVTLSLNDEVVDALGQIGNSSTYSSNETILRRMDIEIGDNNPFDAFTVAANMWEEFPQNFNDDLGAHTSTCVVNFLEACINIVDPCVCLDNATNDSDGQFGELIEITGIPGDIWQVTKITEFGAITNGNGLYIVDGISPLTQATSGVVYPQFSVLNAEFTELSGNPGTFQLAGVHVDGLGYEITVTNLFSGQILTIGNSCTYPNLNVAGLNESNNVCVADGTYDFTVAPDVAGQLDVTVNSVSAFSGTTAANAATPISLDLTTLGTGTYNIEVTFDADAGTMSEPGCTADYSYLLFVGEPAGTMSCNDNVQISLDEDCSVTILPDMILEGDQDNGAFDINIAGVTGNVLTANNIGETYIVTVTDACSGNANSCWSTVSVEDKLAPVIACINRTITCTQAIGTVPAPAALDNCDSNPMVTLIDQVLLDDDACDDNTVTYSQTYIAVDNQGNTSETCERIISVVRPDADQVNFPDDLVWSCEQYAAHPYIINPININPNISNNFGSTFGTSYSLFPGTAAWDLTGIPVNSTSLTQIIGATGLPTGSGIPTEIDGIYCQYGYASADVVVETCGFAASTDSPVFKIVRTWTVLNWCDATIVTSNNQGEDNIQIIKVIDQVAPVTSGANIIVNANIPGAHPEACKGQGPIALGTATDNCTGVVEINGFVYSDIALNSAVANIGDNGLINPALPVGNYFVVWTAEDACGNVGQSTTYTLEIADQTAPVAVCDEITQVALSSDGLAVIYAETFDDGSYDNCCLDRFEVRRMTDNCGVLGNTTFDNDGDLNDSPSDPDNGEFVTFCCSDITNSPVMVVFRAYDCNNNFNECMIEVLVEDKLAPVVVCPANATLTCDEFADNLEVALLACDGDNACESIAMTAGGYGDVTAFDNCSVETTPTVVFTTDQCGVGSVVRSFSGVDPSGNASNVCTQVITITQVSDWCVEFPEDINGVCNEADPSFGTPEIFFETCELIAISFEDQVFDVVADACFKIVRQWTVINWCTVGDNIDQQIVEVGTGAGGRRFCEDSTTPDGYITYQQVIKVQDFDAPVIDEDFDVADLCIITGNDGTDNDFSECTFSGTLPTPTYEDCTLLVNGNLDNNGNIIENELTITATVFDAAGNVVANSEVVTDLEIGCYVVRYTAVDRCGNTSHEDYDFCVNDCKFPTPYCVQGLVIELMAVNDSNNDLFFPMVNIWASDFDAGSYDNCDTDVDISFSTNPLDTSLVFTCNGFMGDNLTLANGGSIGAHLVQIYVTDDAGNQSFCETVIQIQANQDQCDNGTPLVAGTVETEGNAGVENVEMNANGNGMSNMLMTDVDGTFNMNLPQGGDYTLVPAKDIDPLNGVSTFDLVKISKHILNVELLDSPYKMIAADINNSQSITTLDLVKLRRMILLIDTEFTNNTSWRFVDATYTFPTPTNPWAESFPEIININNLDADMMNGDFIGVKIGDINASAQANNLLGADDRTAGDMTLIAQSTAVKTGEIVRVDFTANDFMALGMQFTLNFNQTALNFIAIENGLATDENFGLTLLEEGAITFSWNTNDAVRLTKNDVLFTLVFNGNTDAQISDLLSIDSKYTTAEAYNANEEILDVNLDFNGTAITGAFELHQNRPNPFSDETTISFNLPTEQNATITVSDLSGKVLKVIQNNFAKGYNEINLAKADLNATGVIHYTLATSENSSTKMMVLMK